MEFWDEGKVKGGSMEGRRRGMEVKKGSKSQRHAGN